MKETKAHLENTWFYRIGDTSENIIFYYRIHSPILLIEFNHQKVVRVLKCRL